MSVGGHGRLGGRVTPRLRRGSRPPRRGAARRDPEGRELPAWVSAAGPGRGERPVARRRGGARDPVRGRAAHGPGEGDVSGGRRLARRLLYLAQRSPRPLTVSGCGSESGGAAPTPPPAPRARWTAQLLQANALPPALRFAHHSGPGALLGQLPSRRGADVRRGGFALPAVSNPTVFWVRGMA